MTHPRQDDTVNTLELNISHPRPRKGKHDARVFDYLGDNGLVMWAVSCGCGFQMVDIDQSLAQGLATKHYEPGFERPVLAETLFTSKGDEVEVVLSDAAAAEILKGRTSNFAQDLAASFAKFGSWTVAQRPWAHKLANEAQAPQVEAPLPHAKPRMQLTRLATHMGMAGDRLKFPRVALAAWLEIKLMTSGKNVGRIAVTDGGKYPNNEFFGYIEADGAFNPRNNLTQEGRDLLVAFDADPAGAAAAYGRETGSCCFCRRDLTAADSLAVGYGPICADKYGLPHGA
jgi:hypothetical protein